MKVSFENLTADELTISLSGDLGLENVDELKRILELRLPNMNKISIELKDVESFDLSTQQIFLAAAIYAKNKGQYFKVHFNIDQDLTQLIETSGITENFINKITLETKD
ncbi:MAG: STAS domain-containing protein [Bacteroidales bacterium]|nr:STAS domain-containing protein [Bacteroidales bacterium]